MSGRRQQQQLHLSLSPQNSKNQSFRIPLRSGAVFRPEGPSFIHGKRQYSPVETIVAGFLERPKDILCASDMSTTRALPPFQIAHETGRSPDHPFFS